MGIGQETSGVRAGHEIPTSKLEDYLVQWIPGFARPLTVQQFKVGQSNPTFLVIDGKGMRYVVRKKPSGKLVATAHMIEREFQVLNALKKVNFPVPATYVYCEDSSIIGTPFYVMQFLEGRIFTSATLDGVDPATRKACYDSAVKTLATLHSLNIKELGLESFGKASGFYERQISRMLATSRAQEIPNKVPPLPHLEELLKWFAANLPKDEFSIIHGDYKFDNIIFHPTEPRVIGVLDWEMSTIGHPLSDLANISLPFYFSDDYPPPFTGIAGLDPKNGIPSEVEFLQNYCKYAKRNFPIPGWQFCISFSFFRMAVILQGVASRSAKGQASNPAAEFVGALAGPLAELSWDVAHGGKSRL